MKKRIAVWLPLLVLVASCPAVVAQATPKTPATKSQSAPSSATATQKKNVQEYIELLRANVRDQKAEIMGSMMELNAADAAKFWPIYSEYDTELAKVNDLRVANIKEYAQNYTQMNDDKADELIQNAMNYRKQRAELLAKYYGHVKQALGAVTAARFVQVEDQLLLIIDLQIASSLPIVGE
jgi:flagellar biosynthesis chaperone FliJ